MAGNVLGKLFGDMAESIRKGLPDVGKMKPLEFPEKIDAIVSLLSGVAGGGSGGSGGSGGNMNIKSGSFQPTSDDAKYGKTITHGFDTMPDIILVYFTGLVFTNTFHPYILYAWGVRTGCSLEASNRGGVSASVLGGQWSYGIEDPKVLEEKAGAIYCPDEHTFRVGQSGNSSYSLMPSDYPDTLGVVGTVTYHWIAISGVGSGGTVSDERVKYVTFLNWDGTGLYQMPVAVGDTCQDPVTKGYIPKPQKEGTVSTAYTYSGWSLTKDGSASSSALKNVTEDRTVYATFTESVREYTVNFYDGDTLLATQKVPYGSSASYDAVKPDNVLVGWKPEPTNVNRDMDCYAVWEESFTFADASWKYIIAMAESGRAEEVFAIGDTRTEQLGDETVTYTIVDFNKDTIYESQEKAGITILSNVLATNQKMFSSKPSSLSDAEWEKSLVYNYLQLYVKQLLPSELKSGLKNVEKTQERSSLKSDGWDVVRYYTGETVWVPCSYDMDGTYTSCYSYFKNNYTTSRMGYKQDGTASEYWLRDGARMTNLMGYWKYVNTKGQVDTSLPTSSKGIRFGFCV